MSFFFSNSQALQSRLKSTQYLRDRGFYSMRSTHLNGEIDRGHKERSRGAKTETGKWFFFLLVLAVVVGVSISLSSSFFSLFSEKPLNSKSKTHRSERARRTARVGDDAEARKSSRGGGSRGGAADDARGRRRRRRQNCRRRHAASSGRSAEHRSGCCVGLRAAAREGACVCATAGRKKD